MISVEKFSHEKNKKCDDKMYSHERHIFLQSIDDIRARMKFRDTGTEAENKKTVAEAVLFTLMHLLSSANARCWLLVIHSHASQSVTTASRIQDTPSLCLFEKNADMSPSFFSTCSRIYHRLENITITIEKSERCRWL
jgi:hypothetical protein